MSWLNEFHEDHRTVPDTLQYYINICIVFINALTGQAVCGTFPTPESPHLYQVQASQLQGLSTQTQFSFYPGWKGP